MNIDDEKLRMYFDFFGSGVIEIYRRWVRGEYSFDLRSLIEMAGYATRDGIYPFISDKFDKTTRSSYENISRTEDGTY